MASTAPLRYLSSADVEACLPSLDDQVALAGRALWALGAGGAEMPSKIGVHPRTGALLHAMPAWLRDDDLVGLKWVSAYGGNSARGIPAINGLIVLNEAETGLPIVVMDAALITAVRTAAVSGVAIRLFLAPGPRRAAVIGAGVQAHSHLPHLARAMPGGSLRVHDRHRDRAEALAAAAVEAGFASAEATDDARSAVVGADLVVTMGALGSRSQVMTPDWVRPGALVVAVDFATHVAASLAREAARFVVDDREQFLAYRDAGRFEGYPEPTSTLGELLSGETGELLGSAGEPGEPDAPAAAPPADGRTTVVTHLGVGLADVLFADAVRAAAEASGLGMELPR
jgi:alanine dehydrogenase